MIGVLLQWQHAEPVLFCRANVSPQTYKKKYVDYCGRLFQLRWLDNDTFEQQLTDDYQRDSSEARQMMEDIGNEADFFTLAEELPNSERSARCR